MADKGPDEFKFGLLFESALQIERGPEARVRTWYNEQDCQQNEHSVRDAANRSDFPLVSPPKHEGEKNSWYSPDAPEFVESFAHSEADAVVCHGAHFMRGVKLYNRKPIFYNPGSLLMEFEGGKSIISPEMYEAYGHPVNAPPSHLHRARAKNQTGAFTGFNAESRFSQNAVTVFDLLDGKTPVHLLPLDLGMNRERVLDSGPPQIVSHQQIHKIAALLTRLSAGYSTELRAQESDGLIVISA